jgi:O-antigen ligase
VRPPQLTVHGLDPGPPLMLVAAGAAAGLMLVGAPVLALTLVILLGIGFVVGLRQGTMRLLVAALPTSIMYGPPETTINASPADFILIFAVAGALAGLARAHLDREEASWMKAVLVYACAVIVVVSLSLLWVVLLKGDSPLLTYSILGNVKLVSVMVYFAVFALVMTVQPDAFEDLLVTWKWVSSVIVVVGVAVGVLLVVGVHTPLTDTFMEAYRLRGPLADPNAFAAYCVLSLSLIYVLRMLRNQRAPVLMTAMFLVAILLTGSRAAAPAVMLAGLVVVCTSAPMRKFLMPVVPSVGITVILMFLAASAPSQVEAISRVGTGVEGSTQDDIRYQLWSTATRLWTDNPVFGVGIGQFQAAGQDLLGFAPGNIPHQTYLSLLAELGVIGFLVILSMPAVVGYRLYKLHRAKNTVASAMLIGFLTFAVQAMTLNLENFRPFWAFLGIAYVYTCWVRRQGDTASVTPSSARPASMRSAITP